ncbi:hypothetical protein R3P38DRAFT_2700561 [Favolaschia claudopus]|uniref:Calcium-dependent phosphotriesterase n=1 Tax=Favolaschia claudopus TaxID=2862362 RepID=A0AAW0C3B8_9AGAR
MRLLPALAVLGLSIFVWNRRRPGSFMFKRNLPVAFYAHGDARSHCEVKHAPGLNSCEDAAFWDIHDPATNSTQQVVLITCDPGRVDWNTVMGPLRNPDPHGNLWLLAMGKESVPQRITFDNYPAGHDFHPLGIAISPFDGDTPSNLFIVNHARERTVIEQFTMSPASAVATHVRTLSSPYFISPNSISLTSSSSFYVSNDHFMTRRLPWGLGNVLPVIETFLTLPLGYVSHITLDPAPTALKPILEHKFAALFLPFANGVSISPDGLRVAIASSTPANVHIYSRNPANNVLKYVKRIPVQFHPDNLDFDATGALIISGHPHFFSLAKMKEDPAKLRAPSWVSALGVATDEVQTLFQSDGTYFSSSTTGLRDSKTNSLYVLGLYESGVLVCREGE